MRTGLGPYLLPGLLALAHLISQAVTCLAQITLTNPAPASNDRYGYSVTGLGSDRLLIGAPNDSTHVLFSGAAYLLSTNGTLLTTFVHPAPQIADWFGVSVAAVGSDHVVIGAYQDDTGTFDYDAGTAHLFSTNGTLLTTFTNPTPAYLDYFGHSLAGVGKDRVLIGASRDDRGATDAGTAYLFSTNGALLITFTNPAPAHSDFFGVSVAAVGSDRVLIGANGDNEAMYYGAAYLFSTDGTLLKTFTDPTPRSFESFGFSVAGMGKDRLLISAPGDGAGAVYLYSTDGTLLKTFTNPTPSLRDSFGWTVATVGNGHVLIGAHQNSTGADSAGVAYLYSTNGTLLTTFTNPTPAHQDLFGWSAAAVGSDHVLIGAYWDDTGADNAGSAYLFSLGAFGQPEAAPELAMVPFGASEVQISWTPGNPGFVLRETIDLSPADWRDSPSGATNPVVVPAAWPTRFYRLYKP